MKTAITLGMPHLNNQGLDEIWLLKHLGELHWKMLDKVIEVTNPRTFYASFFNVSINFDNDQSYYREFDKLKIESKLLKFNNKIFRSVHTFENGIVTMDSIFVVKNKDGDLEKHLPVFKDVEVESIEIDLDDFQKAKKNFEVRKTNQIVLPFKNLFNDAKILYFANFLFLVHQSEILENQVEDTRPIRKLKIKYFGNMKIGDFIEANSTDGVTKIFANKKQICHCEIER